MSGKERRLRKEAVEIAAQLPENLEDALAILRYAAEVVRLFIDRGETCQVCPHGGNVAPFPLADGAETSLMRREKPTES